MNKGIYVIIVVEKIDTFFNGFYYRGGCFLKAYLVNLTNHSRIVMALFISLIIIFFCACSKELDSKLVTYNLDDYSSYFKVAQQTLPSYGVEQSENKAYYILNDGGIAEAFDTQAVGAIESKVAKHWYPQYLATVIIAVDRNQTDLAISTWSDLFATKQEIGFFDTPGNIQMLTAAMSYGLEGENYSLTKSIELLASLNDHSRLKVNSFEAPIIICYDYQAANLIEDGRNIEIIIPSEGTFTYEKGLLSNEKLEFQGHVEKSLLEANLRLLDGKADSDIYPQKETYEPAVRVLDYKHFAKTTGNVRCLIEREVLNSRKYMSIDNREHLYIALIYIIIVTIWVASVLHRSMQKGISYAAFFTGIILNSWTLVRLVKYQFDTIPGLTRYLWYSFYIFQLSLPLVLIWMAWAIDKPKNEIVPPKWWRAIAIVIGFLIIFVFTNDLHGLVFNLDLSRADWGTNYSYRFGYYIILFVSTLNLLAVFAILIKKSVRNPRKKGFIFPTIIFIMFAIYNYKYIIRDPFIYKTDLTIITGIFNMLMFESCIRSGLIPVNTKYVDLFARSPLKMQIINNNRETILASATSEVLNGDTVDKVIDLSPRAFSKEDSLLFANPIPGGYTIWHEDISQINKLHKDIQSSTQMLTKANAILAEEEKSKRSTAEESVKKQLMEQLEAEIDENTKKLKTMIENLPKAKSQSKETTRIALLLCYIKRRCSLFFKEKKTNAMDGDKLIAYIEELSEIAKYSNVEIAILNEIKENIDVRYAILFYDFSYLIVDFVVQTNYSHIIQHIGSKDELLTMGFLGAKNFTELKLEANFIDAIEVANGKIVRKELEDSVGISISFPKGVVRHD